MASKELIEKVAREIAKSRGRDPEECVFGSGSTIHGFTCHQKAWEREIIAAKSAISTILAALQEPTEGMRQAYRDANCWPNEETIWRAMLAASALGEQAE
ncbi:hypothetical protein F9K85_13280 [Brucella tritici]|uniref:hypothetical protein n=1 Tax=Brucella tritici TaxID=94626 RepID=UPI00124E645F|nr:hypothetical protein [Brucella tritici]KAB2675878.1 hypothetical protein F9K85_13280 [Brucella tritici]